MQPTDFHVTVSRMSTLLSLPAIAQSLPNQGPRHQYVAPHQHFERRFILNLKFNMTRESVPAILTERR